MIVEGVRAPAIPHYKATNSSFAVAFSPAPTCLCQVTTASNLPAGQPDQVPRLLNGAQLSTLDEVPYPPGEEPTAQKTPLQARTGSTHTRTDGKRSVADIFLAGTSAFEVSANDPDETPYTARNTPTVAATTNAAEVTTRETQSASSRDAFMRDTGEPDDPTARHAFTANVSPTDRAVARNTGSASPRILKNKKKHNDEHTSNVNHSTSLSSKHSKRTVPDSGDAEPQPSARAGGGVMTSFATNDYYVVVLLVASIVLLSVLPSGGSARHAHAEDGPDRSSDLDLGAGADDAQMELIERHRVVSEAGDTEPATAPPTPRAPPVWAVVASSKLLFMVNFVLWVSLAMGFSAYAKGYLRETREPIGLVVLQGTTGVAVLGALGRFKHLDLFPKEGYSPAAARRVAFAASMHTAQAFLTNFAVLLGGVAATNALKAMEPIAAAGFSYWLLGKSCSGARLASIFVIAAGIVVFTVSSSAGAKAGAVGGSGGGGTEEGSFSNREIVGISTTTVVAAVCCNALRNVFIKKGDPIPPHQTLFACSVVAAVVGVGMMFLRLAFRVMDDISYAGVTDDEHAGRNTGSGNGTGSFDWIRITGFNASLCFVGYNFASFNLLARLTPVGHAVGNSFKRVLVFAGGLVFLGEVMNTRQLGGAALALAGVLAYNVSGAQK